MRGWGVHEHEDDPDNGDDDNHHFNDETDESKISFYKIKRRINNSLL